MKLDHIGIVTVDTAAALNALCLDFDPAVTADYTDSEKGFTSKFISMEGIKLEYLQPLSHNSILSGYIKKYGEGLHHLSFEVEDIYNYAVRLKEKGIALIGDIEELQINGQKMKYIFIHPKSLNNVLVELHQKLDG